MEERLTRLITEVKNGSNLAFSELSQDFSGLMRSQVIKLFGNGSAEYDDLLQDAAMALYDAAVSFDMSQDRVTFGLYAKICIKNRLISVKRKQKKSDKKTASYDAVSEKQIRDASKRASREKLEEHEEMLSRLSVYERSVLVLYLNGHSYREIGSTLNKSEKSVDNALYRIKSKLKGSFKNSNGNLNCFDSI